jgi:hypothetical protein
MIDAPRPANLGEILDRTVSLYRARFLVFLGISAIPTVAMLAIASGAFLFLAWFGSSFKGSTPRVESSVIAGILIAAAVTLALPVFLGATALASAAMTEAVNRAYFDEKTSIRAAYKAVWGRGWGYVGLYLLQALIVWGVPIGAWTGAVMLSAGVALLARSADLNPILFTVPLILLVVVGLIAYTVWMLLRLSLAFPASVIEQIGPWAALKRSSALSKGTRWRVLALYMLTLVLTWILSFGLAMIVTVAMMLIPGTRNAQQAQTMGMIVLFVYYASGFVVQALTKPVYGIALVLFYYDQRIRKEGFDIEWMMQRAGLVAAEAIPTEAATAQPWMAADGQATELTADAEAGAAETEHAATLKGTPAGGTEPQTN